MHAQRTLNSIYIYADTIASRHAGKEQNTYVPYSAILASSEKFVSLAASSSVY